LILHKPKKDTGLTNTDITNNDCVQDEIAFATKRFWETFLSTGFGTFKGVFSIF
jgi:hypothetical protein